VKKMLHPPDKREVTLTIDPPLASRQSAAAKQARENLEHNLAALKSTQPDLQHDTGLAPETELVFARDGSLSARLGNRWWSGCSVPRLAARELLRKLELHGAVGCFLAPTHSSQVRAALDRLRPEQALLVAVPSIVDLMLMLHCEDFSADLTGHRVWFAAGDSWQHQLAQILEQQSGLAAPSQFIRMPAADADLIAGMVSAAQQALATVGTHRAEALRAIRSSPRPGSTSKTCVIAPSRFRLWNDAGHALLNSVGEGECVHLDPDDPCSSSTIALANAAAECGTLLCANTSRADLAGVVSDSVRWITWLTAPRIPEFRAVGARDVLILADAAWIDAALRAGWPRERLHAARWPAVVKSTPRRAASPCAIFADTHNLDRPDDLNDYSSHGLLWDFIRDELLNDPFRVGGDLAAYLAQRMSRFAISADAVPRARFVDQLIVPAYQQGIARVLAAAKVPLKIFGAGWTGISEFRAHAAGALTSRSAFVAALAECSAVVHVWPVNCVHPSDSCGISVIAQQPDAKSLLLGARRAIVGTNNDKGAGIPPLSRALVRGILERS